MNEFKICPECKTENEPFAWCCTNCYSSLDNVEIQTRTSVQNQVPRSQNRNQFSQPQGMRNQFPQQNINQFPQPQGMGAFPQQNRNQFPQPQGMGAFPQQNRNQFPPPQGMGAFPQQNRNQFPPPQGMGAFPQQNRNQFPPPQGMGAFPQQNRNQFPPPQGMGNPFPQQNRNQFPQPQGMATYGGNTNNFNNRNSMPPTGRGYNQEPPPIYHGNPPLNNINRRQNPQPVQQNPPSPPPIIRKEAKIPDGAKEVMKGQRLSISEFINSLIEVEYSDCGRTAILTVSPVAFILKEGGTPQEEISIDKTVSNDKSVKCVPGSMNPHISVKLSSISKDISKIIIGYEILEDPIGLNFSKIMSPSAIIKIDGQPKFFLKMDDLQLEKTAIATEFYLHKGEWKMKAICAGQRARRNR